MDIGQRISKRLSDIEITQAALAKRLNTSETTVSHWITGKFRPGSRYLKKLAEELQTTTSYLNGETDNPNTMEGKKQPDSGSYPCGEHTNPKGRSFDSFDRADFSLKMGPWGVSAGRRMAGGMEIKLEAPSGTEKKIKPLMNAVWEIIGGGYVTGSAKAAGSNVATKVASGSATPAGISPSEALDRKRTEAHLLIETLDEEQLDKLMNEA